MPYKSHYYFAIATVVTVVGFAGIKIIIIIIAIKDYFQNYRDTYFIMTFVTFIIDNNTAADMKYLDHLFVNYNWKVIMGIIRI
jgi:hypothetical protein